ncbi:MAG: hypothetical protein RQ847_04425 [Wenzhouxiangellaceae bacterium]|nr:hypothetical protein [Wenzhouxiangellaceae bacterium]
MRTGIFVLAALGLAASITTGCYESADVTLYEPGIYKGRHDSLLDKLENPELRQKLDQRFDGQRDR